MSSAGWMKIYRRLAESELWLAEPFSRGQAWVDLLLLARFQDGFTRMRGVKVDVKRGQLAWPIVKLAERWRWSQGKVRRFLNELEIEGQIEQQKSNVTSLISITNYERFQEDERADGRANGEQIEGQTESKRRANPPKAASPVAFQSPKKGKKGKKGKKEENIYAREGEKPEADKKGARKKMEPPTEAEVVQYFIENGYSVEAGKKAYKYYAASGWVDSRGNPVRSWKQKMIAVWFKPENKAVNSSGGALTKEYRERLKEQYERLYE